MNETYLTRWQIDLAQTAVRRFFVLSITLEILRRIVKIICGGLLDANHDVRRIAKIIHCGNLSHTNLQLGPTTQLRRVNV